MYDLFYIIEVYPKWYNLILRDTHYCISCGKDLEVFKKVIYNYVRKYKTEERVYKAISGLTDRGVVAESTFARREKDYLSGKHLEFNDLVRGVVEQAIKDNRRDTPYNRTKKRVRTAVSPIVEHHLTPPPPKGVVGKITPRKIQRTMTTVVTT